MDTGACASLISTRLVDQLDKMSQVCSTSVQIAGLSNKIIPVRGQINLTISIADTELSQRFIVCDYLAEDILAGNDMLQDMGVRIDIPNRVLLTNFGKVEFLKRPFKLNKRYKVKSCKNVVVPANSICHFQGKINVKHNTNNYEGVILGYNKLPENTGVCVQNALVYACKKIVPLRCVNTMPYDVTISKNRIVAFMEPLEKSEGIKGIRVVKGGEYEIHNSYPRLSFAVPEEVVRERDKWTDMSELYKQLQVEGIDIKPEIKEKLKRLLAEFSHCFSRNKFDLGEASFYTAKLQLKRDYIAKYVPNREISYKLRPEMDKEIKNLLNSGQIEECKYTDWNCCSFLVQKPGTNSYRLVQDMRALNSQCLPDNFELPKISTIMDKMSSCEYLTSFDFTKGFNQIRLEEESRPLTAFSYGSNRYQFKKLVMGHRNSSSQFARCMLMLFNRVPFNALVCFIDDVLIGSLTQEEHIRRLRFVLAKLSWGNLKISPSKTQLFRKEVKFLGHIVNREGLQVDPIRTEAILQLLPPKNSRELQKFLGTMNWNRNYIKNFGTIASPLYRLLQKGVAYNFDENCMNAFNSLKKSITEAPTLALPQTNDPKNSYELTIDSSKIGHGATLTQLIDGRRRVISYWSKAVPKHMQRWGASRLEFLSLYHACMFFRIYLEGTSFTVKTDCASLLNLATIFRNENSFFQRRLAALAAFQFKVVHVSGKSQDIQMADYLSRHPKTVSKVERGTQTEATGNFAGSEVVKCNQIRGARNGQESMGHETDSYTESGEENDSANNNNDNFDTESGEEMEGLDPVLKEGIVWVLRAEMDKLDQPVSLNEIKEEYKHDKILSEVINWLETANPPATIEYRKKPAELCHFRQYFDLLLWKNGVLYRKWVNPADRSNENYLIVVPRSLVERVIYSYHDGHNHPGAINSLELCRRKFYFWQQSKQFKMYCDACLVCSKSKQPHKFRKAPLRPLIFHHFNQCLAVDYLEPSKKATRSGHTAILTMVDMHSNYLVTKSMKSTGTNELISAILNTWVMKYGPPGNLIHDLGPSFSSKLFKEILKAFNIKDIHGVPWNSQVNGRAESMNKRINVAMRTCLSEDQFQDWDKFLPYITFILNSVKGKSGYSSNYIVYGRQLNTPRDLFIQDNERIEQLRSEVMETGGDPRKLMAHDLYKTIADVTRKVAESSEQKAKYMKSYWDKKFALGPYFKKGDWVMLLIQTPQHKFSPRFHGPFKVIDKISDWNYIVQVGEVKKFTNLSKMKEYKPAEGGGTPPKMPQEKGGRVLVTIKGASNKCCIPYF